MPTKRRSKADAIRRARALRTELNELIKLLEEPGEASQTALTWATAIFEKARALEYAVRALVSR